jgi:alpha-beta hydrolase superfamily lysophospholipase
MKPIMLRLLLLLVTTSLLAAQETPPPPPAASAPAARPEEQILMPPEPGRFRALFQRFRTEHAALSPDGRHLAYTVREQDTVYVLVVDLAQPEVIKTRVQVVDDRAATLRLGQNQYEDNPGQVRWLRWVTSNRVVVGTNEATMMGSGAVLGFDADGANARKLADPRDLPTELKLGGSFATMRSAPITWGTPTLDEADEADDATVGEESAALGFNLPVHDDNMVNSPIDPAAVQPHTLQILDLDARRPGAVTVVSVGEPRGNGTHWVDFYSLEAGRGKLTALTETLVQDNEAALLDRQGHVRLTLPDTTRQSFPFRYSYLGARGRNRAKPLDGVPGAAGFGVSPGSFFGERSIPLGFAEDPDLLYYASNLGRDTYGIYSLNLATGRRDALAMENPLYDLIGPPTSAFPGAAALIYDRYSHQLAGARFQATQRTVAWLRPDLQAVQAELEQAMPARSVEVLEWDEAGRRFLVAAEGPADPGAYYLYDRESRKLTEFARRAPWVDANQTYRTLPFAFTLADGTRLDGFVTIPRQPRIKPIPMVLLCPETPWARADPGYNREVHALAGMGFVVAQLSGRGAWGNGRQQREAITTGYDLVQVRDVISAVDALVRRFLINPRRVALLGRGHGGFIALRSVQERPDLFRCAIALEPPIDLAKWLKDSRWTEEGEVFRLLTQAWLGDEARLKAAPLVRHPETITKPVQILSHPGGDGEPRRLPYLAARRFAANVRAHGTTVEFEDLQTDYVQGLPGARAGVFDHIEEFLNLHIYDFNVKLHDLKIIK